MLKQGDVLQQRYLVERILQRGGMSVVYRAHDTALDTTVAIKLMVFRGIPDEQRPEFIEQFRFEGALLARMDHPNLPRVTNFFFEGDNYCLVMDFIDGESLDDIVERDGPQSVERVLCWMDEVCHVLDYLHHQNPPIVFRDLKPGNLMLSRKGSLKLIDFGISKVGLAATKTLLRGSGTPGYCPPEQYSVGDDHTDMRADIYALGATCYTLLKGDIPPEATVRLGLGLGISIRDVNALVPPELEELVARMMSLSPQYRPATVYEVQRSIKDIQSLAHRKAPDTRVKAKAPPGEGAPRKVSVKPYPKT